LPRRTAETTTRQVGDRARGVAACAYVPVICLLPFLLDDGTAPFMGFHARQGMVLFLVELVGGSLYFLPVAGPALAAVTLLSAGLASLWAMHHALRGACRSLPLVGSSLEDTER